MSDIDKNIAKVFERPTIYIVTESSKSFKRFASNKFGIDFYKGKFVYLEDQKEISYGFLRDIYYEWKTKGKQEAKKIKIIDELLLDILINKMKHEDHETGHEVGEDYIYIERIEKEHNIKLKIINQINQNYKPTKESE